jgi:dienelactone hydrolase
MIKPMKQLCGLAIIILIVGTRAHAQSSNKCPLEFSVGYRTFELSDGRKVSLWYPTTDSEKKFVYPNDRPSRVALDGEVATCSSFPVVVFSHGFGGCSFAYLPLTESLARQGYIVLAPNHKDARCGPGESDEELNGLIRPIKPFRDPDSWDDKTYIDRRGDLVSSLDLLRGDSAVGAQVDRGNIAIAGHSLGGYTAIGMLGGWESWKGIQFKAALLLSPFISPFLIDARIAAVSVPVMYQGADRDLFITPDINKTGGVYDRSKRPKFYLELRRGSHFAWTVVPCGKGTSPYSCLKNNPNTSRHVTYSIAFLDKYLKGKTSPELLSRSAGLADYRYDLGG